MKVLLVSPLDPKKTGGLKFLMGGENTFTESLLAQPPSGVKYIHYQQALKEGKIRYTAGQKPISFLMKMKFLPLDAGFQCLEIKEKFDLIHCHAYCLKLRRRGFSRCSNLFHPGGGTSAGGGTSGGTSEEGLPPVVLSDSSSNLLFLRDYLGWSEKRINFGYQIKGWIAKKFALYDPNLHLDQVKKLIVWSNFAKKVHQDLGCNPKKIVVIPPGIPKLPGKKEEHRGFNILFIGVWFERKGGPLLLEAYKKLKSKYQKLKLVIVGQVPSGIKLPKEVLHWDWLPRKRLIKEIYPQADILVLVPPVAEGYGLVVSEAASLAIPSIVSRVSALPEIVQDQETGFIIPPADLGALVNRLEKLIKDKPLVEKMGWAAQKRFKELFWIKETNKKLLRVYQRVMGR